MTRTSASFAASSYRRGSPEWRNAVIALFLAGTSGFTLIYCVQPLLPSFALDYGLSAASSSLAISLTTGAMAMAILVGVVMSKLIGAATLMFLSMTLASLTTILASFSPDWAFFLLMRALTGFMIGWLPAVAMTWLGEELDPAHTGRAMGIYIGGNAFGAMLGRVAMGVAADYMSWQAAMRVLGALGLISALLFLLLLPRAKSIKKTGARKFQIRAHLNTWAQQLRRGEMIALFVMGFTLTGIFATVFNYVAFRLRSSEFDLSQSATSLIFLLFTLGVFSSTPGGALADRVGRRPVLASGYLSMLVGLCFTLSGSLTVIFLATGLMTIGYFISHSVASSAVGTLAGPNRGHGSSLYLWFYYLGASVTGTIGGWCWDAAGWPAIVALCSVLCLIGLGLALRCRLT